VPHRLLGAMNREMTVNNASISVLLSTYNGARWLPELIESVESQTFAGWHVLVRDDGSSDATSDIVASWAKTSSQVTLDPSSDRLGPSGSFMKLLESVDSSYFAFCDQDDVWNSDRLEIGLAHLAGPNPQDVETAVSTGVELVNARLDPKPGNIPGPIGDDAALAIGPLLANNAAIGATMMGTVALARSAVRLSGGQPVGMHDWWCGLVAAARGTLAFDPRPTLRWRRHDATVTGSSPKGLRSRLERRRAYLLEANSMAQRLLCERDAIVSEDALIALEAIAEIDPGKLSLADYRKLMRSGVRTTGWGRTAVLLAACLDPSGVTNFGLNPTRQSS
jgi:rhamnosyltransferase